jgi:hypothetical protein
MAEIMRQLTQKREFLQEVEPKKEIGKKNDPGNVRKE